MRPVFLWSQADLQTNVTGIHLTMENFRGNVRMHFHVARVRIKLQRSIDSGISFSFVANRDEFQVTRIDRDSCHGINDTTIYRGKVNRKFPSRGLRRMFYRLTNNDRKKKLCFPSLFRSTANFDNIFRHNNNKLLFVQLYIDIQSISLY